MYFHRMISLLNILLSSFPDSNCIQWWIHEEGIDAVASGLCPVYNSYFYIHDYNQIWANLDFSFHRSHEQL
ncbi:hypothetical protein V1477_004370 [Vespula maculifrons]|uniref:Uncharacterized protein n=1 Tax=Vespula maculifrons TaxID=7453 RepID=A0ABD2CU24_VESMC